MSTETSRAAGRAGKKAVRGSRSKARGPGAGWWGSFALDPGQSGHWRIEGLQVWIRRAEQEWQIAPAWSEEENEEGWGVELDVTMPEDPEGLQRHVFERTRGPLTLRPVVADRPVVASPRIPLYVPPGERTTLYVGSPLWVQIEVEKRPKLLADIPIRRPSDTWFGPSTREGELCYATRTRAIIDVARLGLLARRAITPVIVENRGGESLHVDRIKLPVPYLSLHASADGRIWTPTVTMVGQEEAGMASFEVGRRPPAEAGAALLTPARSQPEPGLLIRAFSLFRSFDEESQSGDTG